MKKGNGIALTIAAVFAALGIGIITGGTLVSSDNSTSTTATQTEDVVPDVPVRALANRKVLIIATPAANRETIAQIQKQVTSAAGRLTGFITLTPKFAATENDAELSTLVTNALPKGVELPTDRDQNSGRLTGSILGSLSVQADTPTVDAARSTFMDRLAANGFVTPDSFLGEADCAILVSGGANNRSAPNSEDGVRGITIAKIAEGLAQRKVATVVTGATGAEHVNGPLTAAKTFTTKKLAVVGKADKKSGQANIVLRLVELTKTK